ncbi:glycosyltransferase [Bacillus sp. 3255]|uniref:glycosyltransferase n=1 Tax=Bacillus sp. 3255 TaxID=2817904 RepID=UPI00285526AE|nr:glycosyltransferase [Bacillus sp. 3255]MDR6883198.1 glycosyltransferase involved in cell wall biosynthesis [Bacillus sp. 3255]
MNIAFDMSFTRTKSHERAVGKFARRFIRSIQKENHNHSFHSFYPETGPNAQPMEVQLERFLRENAIDLFQILSPFDISSASLKKAWFGTTKVAVLLHDMIPYGEFKNSDNQAAFTDFIRSCDLILTNSDQLEQEAIDTLGVIPEKIISIYGSINRRFMHSGDKDGLQTFGIGKPFVLSTANVFDTKLIVKLIRAFGQVNRQLHSKYQLVIAGKMDEAEKQSLRFEAILAGVEQDTLWLSDVSDGKLAQLYSRADVFVYPSPHKGYGVQALDAMACGTPVLTFSQSPSRSSAAYSVDLANPDGIVQGLLACLTDGAVRNDLRNQGYEWIDRLEEQPDGTKVHEAYQVVLRKKLAIFTPLTPLKSGITAYMNVILPALQKSYECDLFIDGGYEPLLPQEIGEEQAKRIYPHDVFPQKAGQYDEILYQLGDSILHAYITPYVLKYPGVVDLHDLQLKKMLRNGTESQAELIDTEQLLHAAKSILVHNQYAKKKLQSKGFRNVGYCALPQKLPVMISLLMDRDFVFSSFGRIAENKNLELAIRCFKRLKDEGCTDMKYTIAGDGSSRYIKKLKAFVAELGLEQMVEFKGSVDHAEYQTTLSHSDACIQLRYPADGEASGSLLDILSHGKAAIVSDVDSFSELPSGVVCKIKHDDAVEDRLYITMRQLYKDKHLRKQMRERSRNYVAEHHSVSKYVEKFKRIVEDGKYDELQEALADEKPEAAASPQSEAGSDTAESAAPSEETAKAPIEGKTTRTVYISPNRYRRIRIGKRPVSYFSFNLNELPQGCTIERAVMQIPAITKVLRIHRIKTPWSTKSILRRRPRVRKLPIFKSAMNRKAKPNQSLLFTWDCTRLAQNWQQDQLNNHGVFVSNASAVRRPNLHVVVSGEFES